MLRRHSLTLLLLPMLLGVAVSGQPASGTPGDAAIDRDLLDVTVPQLHRLYAERKYTVTQVVQWHLARIDRYNGVYGAIETVLRARALAEAGRQDAMAARDAAGSRGALWGVPIVVKANTSVAGQITTAGWKGFTRPGHELVAPRDATIVARLTAAGAIVVGLANMPDLANSDTNRSTSFGRAGNAYDVRFSPGGSSGGVVTAVAANMAVLGNGTDTGNSIRMPAATSALVGVFPTRGLVSIAGIAPLDWLLDNTGPIARTAGDAAIALEVMAGSDPLDPRTAGAPASAQRPPYGPRLQSATLKGKRLSVGAPKSGTELNARAIFAAAGIYQLTPLKQACLSKCRSPIGLFLHYSGYKGVTRDLRVGLHHGAYCVACCWGLMIVLVAVGVMNIAAMAIIVRGGRRRSPARRAGT
jgi:Asp-tRNA(Asn)/Glu-tRNA(Gln) amidotransferase A subunit family amidase